MGAGRGWRVFSPIQTLWNDFLSGKVLPISSIYSEEIHKRHSCMCLEKKIGELVISWQKQKQRFLLDKYTNTRCMCVNSLGPWTQKWYPASWGKRARTLRPLVSRYKHYSYTPQSRRQESQFGWGHERLWETKSWALVCGETVAWEGEGDRQAPCGWPSGPFCRTQGRAPESALI